MAEGTSLAADAGACLEQALVFTCLGDALLGVLSLPTMPTRKPGVLIVVGGPQYRAGSHRQFVLLARSLAISGHPVLRFDYRGMGDSAGEVRGFEQVSDDISAALDAFQQHVPELQHIVLWGLCDGASAALLYLYDRVDARVAGLCLLNPWVRTKTSLAKTHMKRYYLQRLQQRAFWHKALRGQIAFTALRDLGQNLKASLTKGVRPNEHGVSASYQQRMARTWAGFRGPILLMLSEKDYTAMEFVEFTRADPYWQECLRQRPAHTVELAGADHTCSQPHTQRAVERATVEWLSRWVHCA